MSDQFVNKEQAANAILSVLPDEEPDTGLYVDGFDDGFKAGTQRWIPVTERLPDKGGDYLVSKTFHYGKLTQRFIMVAVYALNLREVDRYTFREDRPGWYDIDSEYGAYEVDNITAWMPLPEPYKEEEDETD